MVLCLLGVVGLTQIARGENVGEAPRVLLETNHGNIILELYPDKAPQSVGNFLAYVDEGYYSGTIFHRVIDGFMIQGGGFTDDMTQKSTKNGVPNEADNGLKNSRGTVAMARTTDPHSATSQFFINLVDNAPLDHTDKTPRGWGYTVFGKVVEGMDVVDAIAKAPTGTVGPFRDVPSETVVIVSAQRSE
ncbi:MAG: peptidylprolyl isomerase [Thermoanaerobaculia bacterium]|jgi:cyclophilin family peptidyl-prolyl cis-trans isomerase